MTKAKSDNGTSATNLKKLLKKKKRHHVFKQPNFGRTKRKRVKDRWRKPRGIDNAQAKKLKKAGRLPVIGYKNPEEIRHVHPSGKKEFLVSSLKELEHIMSHERPELSIIRLRKSLSVRKKMALTKKALENGFTVANPK
ncbi:MAG: 50S ribosomal protein L32e [Candidatus Micrarchaeota archaeon]|nr:50S ribosomal protein L32e [Candidatus Micrarchaeota archaeon]